MAQLYKLSATTLLHDIVGGPEESRFEDEMFSRKDLDDLYDLMWEKEDESDDSEEEKEKPRTSPAASPFLLLLNSLSERPTSENECSICFCEFSDVVTELECGHRFCQTCVESYLELTIKAMPALHHKRSFVRRDGIAISISQRELIGVRCPHFACLGVIQEKKIREIADEKTYSRFDQFTLEEQLRRMVRQKELRPCPLMCGYIAQEGCLCVNPDCRKKQLALREKEKKRIAKVKLMMANDTLLEKWAVSNPDLVRLCPLCSTQIEKNGGCDHMSCTKCAQPFLWSKALPFKSASHWLAKQKEEVTAARKRLEELGLLIEEDVA